MKGRLIVIEGTDGSGKATQAKMLMESLRSQGLDCETLDYPQYQSYSSEFVRRYLRGEYGTAEEMSGYKTSLFYAMDRFASSVKIRDWLEEGKTVILDRYTASNMGHQGGKIKDKVERESFFRWLEDLEFNILENPRPDINIFLHVPIEVSQKLAKKKWSSGSNKIQNMESADIHEKDSEHLRAASKSYLHATDKFDHWVKIECSDGDKVLPIDVIHEKVCKIAFQVLKA